MLNVDNCLQRRNMALKRYVADHLQTWQQIEEIEERKVYDLTYSFKQDEFILPYSTDILNLSVNNSCPKSLRCLGDSGRHDFAA